MIFSDIFLRRILLLTFTFGVAISVISPNLVAETRSLEQELRSLEKKIDRLSGRSSGQPEGNILKSNNGDWIGRFVVDEESIEICELKIKKIKAHFSNQTMTINFENADVGKKIVLSLDGKNKFSIWQSLTFQYVEHNRFLDREFKIKGSVLGNVLSGTFFAEVTRVGDSCSGEVYFVKKGTIEAKAYLENRDPRIVRLEHKLATLQKSQQSKLKNRSDSQNAILAKAVGELKRFKELRRNEQARLAKLKAESRAQAKKLAAIKRAQKTAKEDAAKSHAMVRKKQTLKRQKKLRTIRLKIEKDFGSYHALVIGINSYKNLPRLKTAIADAKAIAAILKNQYGFKVTTLLNPSRDGILNKIDDLRSKLTFNDNLLIYYSGHGQLDQKADEGYWLPVNAKIDRRSKWLSNSTLTSALRAFEAKHVMIIADSCYSGRLTRGISVRPRSSHNLKFLKKLARKKARVVLTSGGLSPVDDDNGSGHSPFADALLKALRENKGIFDGTSLFKSVRRPVQLDTRNQEPQYSDLRRAGHEGGDFIFVKGDGYAK